MAGLREQGREGRTLQRREMGEVLESVKGPSWESWVWVQVRKEDQDKELSVPNKQVWQVRLQAGRGDKLVASVASCPHLRSKAGFPWVSAAQKRCWTDGGTAWE